MPYFQNKLEARFVLYTNEWSNSITNYLTTTFPFTYNTFTTSISNRLHANFRFAVVSEPRVTHIPYELRARFNFLNTTFPNSIENKLEAKFNFQYQHTFSFSGTMPELRSNFTFKGGSTFKFSGHIEQALRANFSFVNTNFRNSIDNVLQARFNFAGGWSFKIAGHIENKLQAKFNVLTGRPFKFSAVMPELRINNKWFKISGVMPAIRTKFTFSISQATVAQTYSFNIKNEAITTYTNWGFLRLVRFRGVALGIKDGMVYTIGGNTDDGTNIASKGRSHFSILGNNHLTRVYALYLKLIVDGDMDWGVMPNAETLYKYRLPMQKRNSMQVKRRTIGRGLLDTDYAFVFNNVNGSRFMVQWVAMLPKEVESRVSS